MVMISNGPHGHRGPPHGDPSEGWHEPCGAWAPEGALRPFPTEDSSQAAERLDTLAGTLEDDIIPRLVRSHASLAAALAEAIPMQPRAADVATFTRHLLGRDEPALRRQLSQLRARGVGIPTLMTHLLAPAARHLGRLWEQDQCHFADVTIGVGRLQQIMRALSSEFGTEIDPLPGGRRALLMAAPGEQHTFGLSMVSEFFARAGWDVAGLLAPQTDDIQNKVANEWFDLVGITAGGAAQLAAVRSCVGTVRRHSHNRQVVVMVGGPLFLLHPELNGDVQADAVVSDGAQAPRLAAQLLDRPVVRRR